MSTPPKPPSRRRRPASSIAPRSSTQLPPVPRRAGRSRSARATPTRPSREGLLAHRARGARDLRRADPVSRHLDLEARAMRGRGEGYYTIGSSGHEGNAVIGCLTRTTDPAFLHYRSGGFMMARAARPGGDPALDTALSLAASADDPISGGRHKVWGSKAGVGAAADLDDREPPAEGASALRSALEHGETSEASAARPGRQHRRVQLRRRQREPRRGARRLQRRGVDGLPAAAGARSCSSARTTASASPCARLPAGSRHAFSRAPRPALLPRRRPRHRGDLRRSRPTAIAACRERSRARSSCTSRSSACSATPAPTWRRSIAAWPRSRRARPPIR